MRTISTIQNPIFGKPCPNLPNLLGRWMSIEGLSIQILPSWFVTATRWKCGVTDALFPIANDRIKKMNRIEIFYKMRSENVVISHPIIISRTKRDEKLASLQIPNKQEKNKDFISATTALSVG